MWIVNMPQQNDCAVRLFICNRPRINWLSAAAMGILPIFLGAIIKHPLSIICRCVIIYLLFLHWTFRLSNTSNSTFCCFPGTSIHWTSVRRGCDERAISSIIYPFPWSVPTKCCKSCCLRLFHFDFNLSFILVLNGPVPSASIKVPEADEDIVHKTKQQSSHALCPFAVVKQGVDQFQLCKVCYTNDQQFNKKEKQQSLLKKVRSNN